MVGEKEGVCHRAATGKAVASMFAGWAGEIGGPRWMRAEHPRLLIESDVQVRSSYQSAVWVGGLKSLEVTMKRLAILF